jgi:hypothetical protein
MACEDAGMFSVVQVRSLSLSIMHKMEEEEAEEV